MLDEAGDFQEGHALEVFFLKHGGLQGILLPHDLRRVGHPQFDVPAVLAQTRLQAQMQDPMVRGVVHAEGHRVLHLGRNESGAAAAQAGRFWRHGFRPLSHHALKGTAIAGFAGESPFGAEDVIRYFFLPVTI